MVMRDQAAIKFRSPKEKSGKKATTPWLSDLSLIMGTGEGLQNGKSQNQEIPQLNTTTFTSGLSSICIHNFKEHSLNKVFKLLLVSDHISYVYTKGWTHYMESVLKGA